MTTDRLSPCSFDLILTNPPFGAPKAKKSEEKAAIAELYRSAFDELTEEDIRSLLRRASEQETDQTCPHARPTRVRFTLADLEKAFHRR